MASKNFRNDNRNRSGNGRNNSRRGNSNPKDTKTTNSSSSEVSTSKSMGSSNSAIANIIGNSANVAIRNVAGFPVRLASAPIATGWSAAAANPREYVVPGAFGVAVYPMFGVATGEQTDPVNLAARNIWMNLRSLYSNKIPYTAGAIMMYTLAMDSIMMVFQAIKRAYGIIFAFDAKNKYVPDALLLACGIDPVDFRENLPDIKVTLNKAASIMSSFGVPTQFDFIYDHVDMCGHVLMDGVSSSAQFIVPYPAFAWKLDWANNKLDAINWWDDTITTMEGNLSMGVTWANIKRTFNGMIEALVNNEDCYQIACDMLRMYSTMAGISAVSDDYAIGPEYSEFYANMLHNAEWLPLKGIDLSNFVITENQSIHNVGAMAASYSTQTAGIDITTTPHAYDGIYTNLVGHIYDFNRPDFTMDDVINASNWKFNITPMDSSSSTTWKFKISSCGTLIMGYLSCIGKYRGVQSSAGYVKTYIYPAMNTTTEYSELVSSNSGFDQATAAASEDTADLWHLHPLIPRVKVRETSSSSKRASVQYLDVGMPSGDMEYYFTLDRNDLEKIHLGIMLSRFDASGTGTVNLKPKG